MQQVQTQGMARRLPYTAAGFMDGLTSSQTQGLMHMLFNNEPLMKLLLLGVILADVGFKL